MDYNAVLSKLDLLLRNSFTKIPSHKKLGVLFSGGVDSSTIAKYAVGCGLKPTLFTFGTEFSKDKEFAQNLAQELKLPFVYLHLTKENINKEIPPIKKLLEKINIDPNIMQVSLSLGFYLIAKEAKRKNIDLFLSGQGSDELFGGYNKYLTVNRKQLTEKMKDDTKNLFKVDVIRDRVMTKQSGIDIYFPYLDKEFIEYVESLPIDLKIHGEVRKWLLRELAKQKGLPDYIFNRPKNALQYSSGIQRIVEKITKKTFLPYR